MRRLPTPQGRLCLVWLAVLSISSVAESQQSDLQRPPNDLRAYTVFLLGNTGVGESDRLSGTLALLRARMEVAGEQSIVVFLGDLIPCCGFGLPGTLR